MIEVLRRGACAWNGPGLGPAPGDRGQRLDMFWPKDVLHHGIAEENRQQHRGCRHQQRYTPAPAAAWTSGMGTEGNRRRSVTRGTELLQSLGCQAIQIGPRGQTVPVRAAGAEYQLL